LSSAARAAFFSGKTGLFLKNKENTGVDFESFIVDIPQSRGFKQSVSTTSMGFNRRKQQVFGLALTYN
jgi:hypothetical protein